MIKVTKIITTTMVLLTLGLVGKAEANSLTTTSIEDTVAVSVENSQVFLNDHVGTQDESWMRGKITPHDYRWQASKISYKLGTSSQYYRDIWHHVVDHWNHTHAIKLVQVGDHQDADIICTLKNNPNGSLSRVVGRTNIKYYKNRSIDGAKVMHSAETYVYHNVAKKMRYTKTQRIHVAEHELGHALGLMHAPMYKSVMYRANRYNGIQKPDKLGIKVAYQS